VSDIFMAQINLQQPYIAGAARKVIPSRMPQHMRMHVEPELCALTDLRDEIIDRLARHRPALAQEQ
jgi:hypothetical protein